MPDREHGGGGDPQALDLDGDAGRTVPAGHHAITRRTFNDAVSVRGYDYIDGTTISYCSLALGPDARPLEPEGQPQAQSAVREFDAIIVFMALLELCEVRIAIATGQAQHGRECIPEIERPVEMALGQLDRPTLRAEAIHPRARPPGGSSRRRSTSSGQPGRVRHALPMW